MAKKKKGIIQSIIDNVREALQALPVRDAIGKSDKRSVKRGKKLIRDLEKKYTPSEVAEAIGISTQKYVSLRDRGIKSGKIASPELNDLLENLSPTLEDTSGHPQELQGDYIADKVVNGKRKFKIDYVEMGDNYIEKKLPWAEDIKPGGFASKQSALNWYGGVTGGAEYFAIVRRKGKNGKTRYHIYDIRTQAEKSRKGSASGKTRASKLYKQDKIN